MEGEKKTFTFASEEQKKLFLYPGKKDLSRFVFRSKSVTAIFL